MTLTRRRNSLFAKLVGLEPPAISDEVPDPEEARQDLEALIDDFEENVTLLAEALAAGTITLVVFAAAMRRQIRQLHLAAAVIGSGGAERATPQTRALAQQQIDQELRYLDQWVAAMQQEQDNAAAAVVGGIATIALLSRKRAATAFVRTTQAALVARARSYGGAAIATGTSGFTRARGLPQLPFQPAQRTRCHGNCRCDWRIVPLAGVDNFDCYWSLGVAEHCPTCVARSRAANPLRVRNGEIVDPSRYTMPNLYA